MMYLELFGGITYLLLGGDLEGCGCSELSQEVSFDPGPAPEEPDGWTDVVVFYATDRDHVTLDAWWYLDQFFWPLIVLAGAVVSRACTRSSTACRSTASIVSCFKFSAESSRIE